MEAAHWESVAEAAAESVAHLSDVEHVEHTEPGEHVEYV